MTMSRRARIWIAVAVVAVAAVGVARLALPTAIRWAAEQQLTALTGLETSVADVDVSVLARRVVAHGVVVGAAADGEPPLASIPRLELALRVPPLFRGRVSLERLAIQAPRVEILRRESGETNLDTLVDRLSVGGEGRFVALAALAIEDGAVAFHDRAVEPGRTWRAADVDVALHDVGAEDPPRGTGSATMVLAGAPTTVTLAQLGLQPMRGQATITTEGLELEPVWAYVPEEAGGRPRGGRLEGRLEVAIGPDGLRVSGVSSVSDVAWVQQGQTVPLVSEDRVEMRFSDLVVRDGTVRVGRLEVAGDPTVTDTSRQPPPRFTFDPLRLVAENLAFPAREPGHVSLLVGVPEDGRLTAQGTLEIEPLALQLRVAARDIALPLVKPYIPPAAPIRIDEGRLSATLEVALSGDTVRANGVFETTAVALTRAGRAEPFVRHPRLDGRVAGLVWRPDDGVSVEQLSVTGSPTIIDGDASPPLKLEFASLSLAADGLAWPAPTPAQVRLEGRLAGGGRATAQGTFTPATLVTDVRARFDTVGVERLAAYLPSDAAVTLMAGTAEGTARLRHTPDGRTRLDGATTVTDLTLALGADARRVTVPVVRAAVDGLVFPTEGPARVETGVALPGTGRLEASGTVALDSGRLDVDVRVEDAALGPYAGLLPVEAPVHGTADLAFEVTGSLGTPPRLVATGRASADHLALGARDEAPVTIARIDVDGVTVQWPLAVTVAEAVVTRPSALVLREADGRFPLRAMLAPSRGASGDAPAEPDPDAADVPPVAIGRLHIAEGDVRFVDRTVTPAYSEELTSLALTVDGLDSATEEPATVSAHAVAGADAALRLSGEAAPFAEPFRVELKGQLRGFALPRTNPYVTHFLDWVVERGTLTTDVHYRIVGDRLEATNELLVQQLGVKREPPAADAGRGLGIPLGLVVAILADHRGDIRVTIPVSGELGSPRFGVKDAFATAFRRLLSSAVTGPFQAIGRIVRREPGGLPQELAIDPLQFPAGVAAVPEAGRKHLQRVADFLRAAPQVELRLRPVVSAADVQALRRQAALAAIQQAQRDEGGDFEAAATRVFERRFPDRSLPETGEGVVAALSAVAGPVDVKSDDLATRRVRTVRQLLIDEAGIEPQRLRVSDAGVPPGVPGDPRVELDFALQATAPPARETTGSLRPEPAMAVDRPA